MGKSCSSACPQASSSKPLKEFRPNLLELQRNLHVKVVGYLNLFIYLFFYSFRSRASEMADAAV